MTIADIKIGSPHWTIKLESAVKRDILCNTLAIFISTKSALNQVTSNQS